MILPSETVRTMKRISMANVLLTGFTAGYFALYGSLAVALLFGFAMLAATLAVIKCDGAMGDAE